MNRTLLQIGILVVLVRLLFFLQLGADPRFDQPFSDALVYHNWGSYWMDGDAYPEEPPGRPFWRSPGYPLCVSLLYRVVGDNVITGPRTAAAIQLALGAAASLAAAAFVLRRWGRGAAWATAILASFHGPLVFMEAMLLPVGLSIPLTTFAGLLVLRLLDAGRPRPRLAAAAGLLAGVNAVIRPNLGLLIPAACGLLLWKRPGRRNAWWLAAAAALPLLGTTAWNLARSGEWVVTGANGPMNFYFAYGDFAGPTFDVRDTRWANPERQARTARRIAGEERGDPEPYDAMSSKEVSRWFADKARDWIAAHPGAALARAAEKALGTMTWRDMAVIVPLDASRGSIRVLPFLAVPFPLLLFLALFAAWRLRGPPAAAVALGYLPLLFSAVMFFTYTRFRVPAVPLLSVAAGPGLVEAGRLLRAACGGVRRLRAAMPGVRRPLTKLLGFAGAVTVLVAASWTPWFKPEAWRDRYWMTPVSQGWLQKGIGFVGRFRKARDAGAPADPALLSRAMDCFATAHQLQPNSPLPEEWTARVQRDFLGRGREAYAILRKLTRDYPPAVYAKIYAELGLSLMAGDGPGGRPAPREADRYFQTAWDHHGGGFQYLEAWADALKMLGRTPEACEKLLFLLGRPDLTPAERERVRAKRQTWNCPKPPEPPAGG